ncbi:chromosome partitioning protein [Salinibacter ruber]|uniref:Chromosome partitioning protein n=2 Tax=Salinibacter ruber TaxID=146919 RepID=A0A9X2UB83_9BACT|nr:ParA family partition ATPase [Salinibacter ruber]MCS3830825.1 chromosome partitioning protein [Salinibacter ruber]MCS3953475.1 chromosome partitioning protein [Salinibacter ruber]
MSLVIGIVSPKGGSGKTTTAVHLARSIQKTGDRVAILDTDTQGSSLAWQSKHKDGGLVPVHPANTDDVAGALSRVQDSADVIVIDGAAKIEARTGRIVDVSDVVLIPVQPTPLDSWGVEGVVEAVRQSGTPAAFLITQQKPRTNLAKEVAQGLAETYELPVLDSRIAHRVAYAEALFDGRTALDLPNATKAKQEIRALTTELQQFIREYV